MLNKLHNLEQQAGHAQCLALLVEFVTAVRGEKVCLMCRRGKDTRIRPAVQSAALMLSLRLATSLSQSWPRFADLLTIPRGAR